MLALLTPKKTGLATIPSFLDRLEANGKDSVKREVEMLLRFKLADCPSWDYILYRNEDEDSHENGEETSYVSILYAEDDELVLEEIPQNEWKEVQEVIWQIVQHEE